MRYLVMFLWAYLSVYFMVDAFELRANKEFLLMGLMVLVSFGFFSLILIEFKQENIK